MTLGADSNVRLAIRFALGAPIDGTCGRCGQHRRAEMVVEVIVCRARRRFDLRDRLAVEPDVFVRDRRIRRGVVAVSAISDCSGV
jgi:hypothetical protein